MTRASRMTGDSANFPALGVPTEFSAIEFWLQIETWWMQSPQAIILSDASIPTL